MNKAGQQMHFGNLLAGTAIAGAKLRPFIIAGAVATGFFPTAHAATPTLPPATYDSSVTYRNGVIGPYAILQNDEIFAPGTATIANGGYASISPAPDPTLTAYAIKTEAGLTDATTTTLASADLAYYFDVVGPSANLPVDISYSGTTVNVGAGPMESFASINFGYGLTETPSPLLWFDEFAGTFTYAGVVQNTIAANSQTLVRLDVLTQSYQNVGDSGFVQLDPTISIDPSFAQIDPNYLSDYSIVTSEGVGNTVAGVPEPATWAMMLLGVGMIGGALRMARRKDDLALTAG